LALAAPAAAQSRSDLNELLASKGIPATRELKTLDDGWRRMVLYPDAGFAGWRQRLGALLGGLGGTVYYSRGETVTLGETSYTVAYRVPAPEFSWRSALAELGQGRLPGPPPLTPATVLTLALLNARSMATAVDVRPFSLEQETAASRRGPAGPFGIFQLARIRARNSASVSNLKQLGTALLIYAQDYDERLPPVADAGSARELLNPYVKNEQIFLQPATGRPYEPNPVLAGRSLAEIDVPAETVSFYEPEAAPDQTRGVAYVDGHVQRLPESGWPRLQQAITEGMQRDAVNAESLARLRAIGTAIRQYAREHDGRLPPLADPAPSLLRYMGGGDLNVPQGEAAYQTNPNLSGKKLAAIRYPAQTVVFYEPGAADDGLGHPTRGLLFLSGRAKRIPEDEWETLRQRLKIP
jgi:hypothetical protein